jgi:hypothetical protein
LQNGGSISEFEALDLNGGWINLVLAVQQQPVIVSVEASQASFMNFKVG